jgi:hypothetical protein
MSVLLIAAVAAVAGFVILRVRSRVSGAAPDSSWRFETRRYRPIERLLSDDDLQFLASCKLGPATLKRVRAERRRLLSRYLRNLETDFSRLQAEARALLLSAPEDRPDLAAAILSQQFAFQRTMWMLKLRLHVPGFSGAAAEVSRLVELAQSMAANARQGVAVNA